MEDGEWKIELLANNAEDTKAYRRGSATFARLVAFLVEYAKNRQAAKQIQKRELHETGST